jgi:hypothetical protein
MYQETVPQTVQERIYKEKLPELKSALEQIDNILNDKPAVNFACLLERLKKITH